MKNIFNTFNRVDIELEDYDDTELNNEEIEKIKKRVSKKLIKKKKFNYRELVAVIVLCLVVLFIFNNNIVSANIDNFNNSFKKLFNIPEEKDYTEHTTLIGKTVTDNNISVMLEEVLLDNNQLIVTTIVDYSKVKNSTKKKMFERVEECYFNPIVSINGEEYRYERLIAFPISDNSAKYITFINIDSMPSDILINCKISYEFYTKYSHDDRNSYLDEKIKGNWDFKFAIKPSTITNTVQKIDLNENNVLELKNKDLMTINKVEKSDISIKVYYDLLTVKEYYSTPPIKIVDSNKNYLYPIYYDNNYAHFLLKDNSNNDIITISNNNDITTISNNNPPTHEKIIITLNEEN